MNTLIRSLTKSILDLFHPKILLLMILPPVLALMLWVGIAFFTWPYLMMFSSWMISWAPEFLQATSGFIAVILAIGMIVPLAVLSVLLFTSIFAMPVIVPYVSKKYFPDLQIDNKGAFTASIKNAFWTGAKYLTLWFATLPLWLIPGLSIAIPLVLNAYLNYKLFIYDALGSHANPKEITDLIQHKRSEFYILGLITSAMMLIPIVFLIIPFYAGIAFTHMGLGELQNHRKEKNHRMA